MIPIPMFSGSRDVGGRQAAVLAWLEERTATEEGQEIGPKRRGPGDLWKGWNGTESNRLGGGFKYLLDIVYFHPEP